MPHVSKVAPFTRASTLAKIRSETKDILLSFSTGKDSLSAWLTLREYGFNVHPFYMYVVPDLQFVERSLKYYEDYFSTHIIRVAHPNSYWWIKTLGFQPPERWQYIDALGLPSFDYPDVNAGVCRKCRLPEDTWCALGTRVVDSPIRRWSLTIYGPINHGKRTFMPIYDMRKDELIALLKKHNVKVTNDYLLFGRSFDGIDYRYIKPIMEHYPEDYQRILERFPLVNLEYVRAKLAVKHGQGKYV